MSEVSFFPEAVVSYLWLRATFRGGCDEKQAESIDEKSVRLSQPLHQNSHGYVMNLGMIYGLVKHSEAVQNASESTMDIWNDSIDVLLAYSLSVSGCLDDSCEAVF